MFNRLTATYRRRAGLTQEALAEITGLSIRSLRNMESGRVTTPRLTTVRLLADAFDLRGEDREQFFRAAGAVTDVGTHPAQLPMDIPGFTGRGDELTQLDALVEPVDGQPGTVLIVAVSGMPGVGKTTLAVHWAHRISDRFPDGQLYVNLRGFDPGGSQMAPAEALRGFLDALGVPPGQLPSNLDAQAALYRSQLKGRRVLVVLDNARDAEQVRPLLPSAAGCLVVVTSRNQLAGLVAAENARPVVLDLMSPAEARTFLAGRIGVGRLTDEPQATDAIIGSCARLPLALAIAAATATTRPQISLAQLSTELEVGSAALDTLDTGDAITSVRSVFSWSYRLLSDEAARLFRLLGLHPGPDVSAAAAASIAATPVAQVQLHLAELVRANLLSESTPGRYSVHDLLREYAAELLRSTEPESERHDATRRMLDHYVQASHRSASLLHLIRDGFDPQPPVTATAPEYPSDQQAAAAWLNAERSVLVALVRFAIDARLDSDTWQLYFSCSNFFGRSRIWHDQISVAKASVAAAERMRDPARLSVALCDLGQRHSSLGDHDDASYQFRRAVQVARDAGDDVSLAFALQSAALASERQGQYAEALDTTEKAYEVFRAVGPRVGEANSLNSLGWLHAKLGDHRQALIHCRHALKILEELGDLHLQGATLHSLGFAHHRLGEYTEAISCYHRANTLCRSLGDSMGEATVLDHLGDSYHATGNVTGAHSAWQQAATIFDTIAPPQADPVRAKIEARSAT